MSAVKNPFCLLLIITKMSQTEVLHIKSNIISKNTGCYVRHSDIHIKYLKLDVINHTVVRLC